MRIPQPLFEQGERERKELGISRSEFVAALYRAHLKDVARREKIARYREAYGRFPPTSEEDALTSMSLDVMATGES